MTRKSYRMFDEQVLLQALQLHPNYIEAGCQFKAREYELAGGGRVDLILLDKSKKPMLVEVKKLQGLLADLDQVLRYKKSNSSSNEFSDPRYILAAPSFSNPAKEKAHEYDIELKELDIGMLLSLWARDEFPPKKDDISQILAFYERRLQVYMRAYLNCCACYRKQQRLKEKDEGPSSAQLEMVISPFQQRLIEIAMKGKVWLYGITGGGIDAFDRTFADWVETCIKREDIEDCSNTLTFVEHEIENLNRNLVHEDIQVAEKHIEELKKEGKGCAEPFISQQERFIELLRERTDISKRFRLDDVDKK